MQQLAQHAASILNRKHVHPAAPTAVSPKKLRSLNNLLVRRSPSPDVWELMKPPDAAAAAMTESGRRPGVSSAETRPKDSISLPVMQRKGTAPRPDLPPWDRSVDVVYHRYKHGDARRNRATPAEDFAKSLARFTSDRGRRSVTLENSLSRLPAGVRFRIGRSIVRSHHPDGGTAKPISLNRRCFNRDCWGASDLTPLGDVLVPLAPCLLACSSLYADVMLALLGEHVFHVTFSPYVGPRLCPLATTWLNTYGVYMRSIVVEVDYTRLGLGPAPGLAPGLGGLEALLRDFGNAQMERAGDAPLRSLVLLCRRFYGARGRPRRSVESTGSVGAAVGRVKASRGSSRSIQSQHSIKTASSADEEASTSSSRSAATRVTSPDTPALPDDAKDSRQASVDAIDWEVVNAMRKLSASAGSQSTPGTAANSSFWSDDQQQQQQQYCPDAHLLLCNHLARLRGRVDALRMCGFSDAYTRRLVATLFPQACGAPARDHCYRVAPSTAWPRLPGQTAYVDAGRGRIVLDDGEAAGGAGRGPFMLPPPVVGPRGATCLPGGAVAGGKTAGGDDTTAADGPEQTTVSVAGKKTFRRLRERYGKGRKGR